ncbi:MAG TPA: hypothetical protein VN797_07065 [Gemmatimonadaceae bacterium]|nr:hypothetical protein [Gemmatimonadaceae bacterium]
MLGFVSFAGDGATSFGEGAVSFVALSGRLGFAAVVSAAAGVVAATGGAATAAEDGVVVTTWLGGDGMVTPALTAAGQR